MTVELFVYPVLVEAVSFLLKEAGELWKERRQLRQSTDGDHKKLPAEATKAYLPTDDMESMLQSKVNKELADHEQEEISSILKRIGIYRSNLAELRERMALDGGALYAPVAVRRQAEVQLDAIQEESERLAEAIKRVTAGPDAG